MSPFSLKTYRLPTLRSLRDERDGSIFILVALAMPVVVGGLALAVETGLWYMAKRQTQLQADAAALGAARTKAAGISSVNTLRVVARNDATRNGYVDSSPNTLTVNVPPTSGSYTGDSSAVEVVIERPQTAIFSKMFGLSTATIRARGVASIAGSPACVLALDATAGSAIQGNGAMNISAQPCVIAANSSSTTAVRFVGAVNVTADTIYTRGRLSASGAVSIHLTNAAQVNQTQSVADPYAATSVPSLGLCNYTNFTRAGAGTYTLLPGVYCGGLRITGASAIRFTPGVYYISKSSFSISGAAVVTCPTCNGTSGVTIVLTSADGTSIATMSISGAASITLPAPQEDTNPFRGFVIYQDRRATLSNGITLSGATNLKLTGAVYAPRSTLTFNGGTDLTAGRQCLQLIANRINFNGAANLRLDDCDSYGVKQLAAGCTGLGLRE
jgi:Flp pilus assembly protein TadG